MILHGGASGHLTIDAAYRHCAEITRSQARNFWYGIRLLPPAKRRAMSALYAFARRVDDIADGREPAETKLAALSELRERLRTLTSHPADPVLLALADTTRRLPVPLEAFHELIDGCEADVRGTRYKTFDDLLVYCRQVAGSIGRLSLGVFGSDDPDNASRFADSLGIALQLTNILRDVKEDRLDNRVYLPQEDLARWSVSLELNANGDLVDAPRDLARLIAFEASRTRQWYDTGLLLLPLLDHRSAACCGAMAGIYDRLLERIVSDPLAVARTRVSVPTWQKAIVAVQCLGGLTTSGVTRSKGA